MTSLAAIAAAAARDRLFVAGGFHPDPADGLPEGTLLLLAPLDPGYWAHLMASPEWQDGAADPLDRWSARVIGALAHELGGTALFPFGGPPHLPFYSWALRSGRAFVSPVRLLVHDRMGLLASYRGAVALPQKLDLPATRASPCDSCEGRPCLYACPPRALTGAGYDLAACHAFLDQAEGTACMSGGCLVRRACPVSQSCGRVAEQSAYHMRQFHP